MRSKIKVYDNETKRWVGQNLDDILLSFSVRYESICWHKIPVLIF